MKKRRAVCKGNNASSVKRKIPDADPGEQRKESVVVGIKPELTGVWRKKKLDNPLMMSIMIFTVFPVLRRGAEARQRAQDRDAAATGNFASALAQCHRRTVPQGQFLRPERPRAGQVRDASPRRARGPVGDRRCDIVRLLSALVLSSPGGLRTSRTRRPRAPQARPETGPQADRASHDFHRRNTPQGAVDNHQGTAASDPATLRDHGSSAKYRTQSAAPSKKRR